MSSVAKELSALPSPSASTSRLSPRQTSSTSQPVASYTCFSCGSFNHLRSKCKFRNTVCRHYKLRGHIARVCKKGGVTAMSFEELLEEKLPEEDELYVVDAIYAISRSEISCH